jgi:hypothetical protein
MIDSNLYRKIEMAGEALLADYKLTYPDMSDSQIRTDLLLDHGSKVIHMSVDNDLLEGIIDSDRQDDPEYKALLLIAGVYFVTL